MAVGETLTLPILRLAGGGAGVGRMMGKTIFMEMTAPGDVAAGRIIEERRNWARAELLSLVQASPERAVPPCPLYGRCGGCSLQHVSYQAQIREKAAILTETLKRIGGWQTLPELKVVPSPEYEYRNRMQLHGIPRPQGDPEEGKAPQVGLMGRKSSELFPLEDCLAADPLIRRALQTGMIKAPRGKERFTVYGRGSALYCEGEGGGPFPSQGAVMIRGQELWMDPGVFFQSNALLLEALAGGVLEAAAEADPSLPAADLYCGVGTFAAFLAKRFPRIDLVETSAAALALARRNVPGRGNRFFAQSGEVWARQALEPTRKVPYGFILADPPRGGLSRTLRRLLREAGPRYLAYVSCDPAALARDSGELREGGYEFRSLGFYDFYPQTAHIESLAVFKRSAP